MCRPTGSSTSTAEPVPFDPSEIYWPGPGDGWESGVPAELGFDAERLAGAVAFAAASETPWSRDLAEQIGQGEFEPPPWNQVLGPVWPRGGPAGLILRGGRIAGQWGDPDRADLTFSVAKSYLAVLAGVALRDGLIRDLDDPAGGYALDDDFKATQNQSITWRHLLQQTSEWEGTLWDKPDLVDRYRELGGGGGGARKGQHRDLQPPGAYWEYNDVRVNRLSLSLLQVFRRPLADVLRDEVAGPIGCSEDWGWHAYRNAHFEIDGTVMPSVPGGTHWGGGLRIAARDQARLGLLIQRRGVWKGRQILPESYMDALFTPCPLKPDYGLLWWLNTGRALYPGAPEGSVFAMGAGGNHIWVEAAHDLTVVTRWLDDAKASDFMAAVMAALV